MEVALASFFSEKKAQTPDISPVISHNKNFVDLVFLP
jgi:hypothetical protein